MIIKTQTKSSIPSESVQDFVAGTVSLLTMFGSPLPRSSFSKPPNSCNSFCVISSFESSVPLEELSLESTNDRG